MSQQVLARTCKRTLKAVRLSFVVLHLQLVTSQHEGHILNGTQNRQSINHFPKSIKSKSRTDHIFTFFLVVLHSIGEFISHVRASPAKGEGLQVLT